MVLGLLCPPEYPLTRLGIVAAADYGHFSFYSQHFVFESTILLLSWFLAKPRDRCWLKTICSTR